MLEKRGRELEVKYMHKCYHLPCINYNHHFLIEGREVKGTVNERVN